MTIKEALKAVVNESSCPYAVAYAKAGLELGKCSHHYIVASGAGVAVGHEPTGKMMVGDELRVQILYVLSNLGTWRGEMAREVKEVLKRGSR